MLRAMEDVVAAYRANLLRVLRQRRVSGHVRYWHLADIDADAQHVRFQGVKRTSPLRGLMSANDPKQTFKRRTMPTYVFPLELLV